MKKTVDRLTVIVFLTVICGFCAAFFALPDLAFSPEENRSLAKMPRASVQAVFDGAFADGVNDWFADQFPLRNTLVGIKGVCETALGKGENNAILLGADGYLARSRFDMVSADGSTLGKTDRPDASNLELAVAGVKRVREALDLPFAFMPVGRNLDVCAASFAYPACGSEALCNVLLFPSADGFCVDTVTPLCQRHEAGEEVYFRTDHHWTARGAYYAYAELMRAWGLEDEILPEDAFSVESVEGFYGTLWSAGGMKFVPPDTLELWHAPNESDFEVIADGKLCEGLYSRAYLQKKDKYSVFLDGTHDVVTVRKKTGGERETLVIFKDSYANAMAPFLAQHFDLVLLNLSSARTDFTDITALSATYRADRVLLIYSMENMITAQRLSKLR